MNEYDKKQHGLVKRTRSSGHQSWYFTYGFHGRWRWYKIGPASMSVTEARKIAAKLRVAVSEGRDPAAERRAERGEGTFAEVAQRYLGERAMKKNKSWRQARKLVEKHLLPRWGNLVAKTISSADVRAVVGRIEAPILANAVLASASAIFSWAKKQEIVPANPCAGIERNKVKNRQRIMNDGELPSVWRALGDLGIRGRALKVLLLTGQRPGEVARMRWEHIDGAAWRMPGEEVPALGWLGTKNERDHLVYLPRPVREIIGDQQASGFVFGRAIDGLPQAMQEVCARLGIENRIRPHDLRRTHGSTITALGFGRAAMNRVQNHKEGGIADVYDQFDYAPENRKIMEAVAEHLLALAEGRPESGAEVIRAYLIK